MSGGMISGACWVPRGAAKSTPVATEPSPEELRQMAAAAEAEASEDEPSEVEEEEDDEEDEELEGGQRDEAMEDGTAAVRRAEVAAASLGRRRSGAANTRSAGGADSLADGLAELDMDHYDEEEEEGGVQLFGKAALSTLYHARNNEDPYITLHEEDEDEDDIDDFTIRETDLLVLAARNEDDVSHLEVWVYDDSEGEGAGSMYVHHDVMLAAFPLALAWMDLSPRDGSSGNFVAVGTMDPGIEVWDLDVLDGVEPVTTLGGYKNEDGGVEAEDGDRTVDDRPAAVGGGAGPSGEGEKTKKKKTKRKKKQRELKEGSHADSVLGLSWNSQFRNVLASASADVTVKVWDVVAGSCERTLTHHSGKVQAVAWNPAEAGVLLTGGFDQVVAVADVRTPEGGVLSWQLSADVECAAWDPHNPHCFAVCTEDGLVRCHDVRRKGGGKAKGKEAEADAQGALYTLSAHDKPTCSLAFNPMVPGLLATGSTDKTVKLWDTVGNRPTLLTSRNPGVGAVFTVAFSRDVPSLLAMGGSKGSLQVWDVRETAVVGRKFGAAALSPQVAEGATSGT